MGNVGAGNDAPTSSMIPQLQLDGGAASVARLAALKKELEDAKKDYNTVYEEYRKELKEKHEAWDSLEAIRNPQNPRSAAGAPQGGSSSFECLLCVVQFAETACVESSDGLDWDHNELRRHVFHMVQSMIPNAKRKDLDRKVQEVRVWLDFDRACFLLLTIHCSSGQSASVQSVH